MKPQFSMNAEDVQKDIDGVVRMMPEVARTMPDSQQLFFAVLQDLMEFRDYLKAQ